MSLHYVVKLNFYIKSANNSKTKYNKKSYLLLLCVFTGYFDSFKTSKKSKYTSFNYSY